MTVDPKVYEFAKLWLTNEGWDNTVEFQALAEIIQSAIEDHMADIQNQYEKDCDHVDR